MKTRLPQKDIFQIVTGGKINILLKNGHVARVHSMLNLIKTSIFGGFFWQKLSILG